MPNPNLRLLAIHRVSTGLQAGDDGEGLDRQRATTKGLVAYHEATPLPPVEIIDVSGSDVDQTTEWRHRVMPLIADPQVHVVVDSIDRILRAEAFNFKIMQDLLATGTRIYAPGKIHDLATPEDSFMAGLIALLGGREKAEIKRRMMAGREAARRRGEWPLRNSALARGIAYDRQTKTWGYDQPEAEIIRSVYHQHVVERRAMRAIGRDLGKPLQVIAQYIRNPIYKGLLRWDERRGEAYPSKNGKQPERKKVKRPAHEIIEVRAFGKDQPLPQLVSDEIWAAAQRILAENSKTFRRRRAEGRPETWASGFLTSALAPIGVPRGDGFIDLSLAEPARHHVYANGGPIGQRRYSCHCCRSDHDLVRCGLRSPRAEAVNTSLDAFFSALTTEDWFIDAVRESAENLDNSPGSRRASLEARLETFDQRESRLTRLYLDGRIDPAQHDKEQDQIRAGREAIRVELATYDACDAVPTAADLEQLRTQWAWNPAWDHVAKRAWLSRYVERIALSNEGIEWAVVRVPAGDGQMPVFGTSRRLDWVVPVWCRAAPSRNRKS